MFNGFSIQFLSCEFNNKKKTGTKRNSLHFHPFKQHCKIMWHIIYFYLRVCITRFIRVAAPGYPTKNCVFFLQNTRTSYLCLYGAFFFSYSEFFFLSFLCCCCFWFVGFGLYIGVVNTIMDLSAECIVCNKYGAYMRFLVGVTSNKIRRG